jgi:Domain of unknown function (DUF4267)
MRIDYLGAYLMGSASIFIGLLSMFAPSKAANLFGIALPPPAPESSSKTSTSSAFLAAKGARDIALGVLYLVFGYEEESRFVGMLTLAYALTAAVDAVVAWNHREQNKENKPWSYGIGTAGLLLALTFGL